ncbi:MAG TPA: VWA domain-containing protein, partial [Pyrinomonadaceae bacterium]|nr:VWA domain-containing protein [Pyrinomonadaceae bacterium]
MKSSKSARASLLILFACLMSFSLLFAGRTGNARTQDARPRRAASPAPTASPSPARSIVMQPRPSPTPRQSRPVQVDMSEQPPTMIVRPRVEATPSPSPSPDNGEEVDPDAIVRVNTDLVTLNVRVVDRNNRPINDARQPQFHVFENGVEQPIEFFSTEEVPITYGLVVDNSGSMRSQIETVIEAAKSIINSNRPGDETFIERFVDREKIEVLREFTANKQDLMDGLDDMIIEGGQTAVIDAVYLGAEHVSSYKKSNDLDDRRRRALILVTDGEDRESFYNQERLFQALHEEDVQIFVIGFVNELDNEGGLIRKSPRDRAVSLINRLASET